ncbi:hypothetical protein DRJ25_02220 [Candidatus Woesearchaeota archaeon]|nr:MAG: hypothetical protein DRJ25_02220 [Candidatus Woesearchaeota archaeon]
MDLIKLNAWLLLIAGIILFVPGFYVFLADFTKGQPWLLIFFGLLSIVVSGVIIFKKLYVRNGNGR